MMFSLNGCDIWDWAPDITTLEDGSEKNSRRSKNKPPWRRKKKKTLKNPVINFSLAAVFCEVVSATPPPHKHTPYFHGFDWDWRCWRRSLQKKNQHWLPFSQLNTKRLALLKFSTSASGLGYRKRRGEKKKQEKGTLLHFLKFWL